MNPAPALRTSPTAPKKRNARWFILGGLLLLGLGGGGAYYKNKNAPVMTAVTTDKAIVKTITQVVTATGKVQPETEVKISPEVAGEIIALPVKEGQSVQKGDLLVKIKPDFYQAQLDQQEASLVSAKATAVQSKAQLLQAQSDLKRSEDLFTKKLVSDSEYSIVRTSLDVAQANYENALAQIRRAEGSLNQTRDQLSKTIIYAPMDGTISSLSSEVGERVAGTGQYGGAEIMRLADLTNMELRVKVNENDIVNVKIDDRAVISIDAYPGRKFSGKVHEISSSAQATAASGQPATQTDDVTNFMVKIRVADRDIRLRPGMSATTDIETQTVENVVAVPIQSVTVRAGGKTSEELQQQKAKDAREKSGNDLDLATERDQAKRDRDKLQRVVFVRHGDTVKMQKIETGIADNTHIQVKSGIAAGDEVVSGSYAAISRKLKDGMKVQLEKPKKEEEKK